MIAPPQKKRKKKKKANMHSGCINRSIKFMLEEVEVIVLFNSVLFRYHARS